MKRISTWISTLITFLLLGLIILLIWMKQTTHPPIQFLNVLSESMTPTFYPGDLVIIKKVNPKELTVGDIITFDNNTENLTHRIERIVNTNGETQFITKGDNNNNQDFQPIMEDNILGQYLFRISKLGRFGEIIQTSAGKIALSLTIVQLILVKVMIGLAIEIKRENKFVTEIK